MTIPIRNLYYLLSYAWDTLDQAGIVAVSQDDGHSSADLFIRILEASTTHLIKRGLDREYIETSEDARCVRGKLDLTATAKRNLLRKNEVHVVVDSLSHQVPNNRILKTTIRQVLRCSNVDSAVHDRLRRVYRYLSDIDEVPITPHLFARVRLHRNNAHYRLPLAVCRLIYDAKLIDETSGKALFRDFVRDERAMATVFEQFLFRFFRREQGRYAVRRAMMPWQGVEADDDALRYLPNMRTDVLLEGKERTIILDAKFYHQTFQTHFGRTSIKSENLYQLYAYLRNFVAGEGHAVEGILLYPTTSREVSLQYSIHGHRVHIATIDLTLPWQEIHERLLRLIA